MILSRIKAFVLQYALVGSLFTCSFLALGLAYSRYELGNAKEVIQDLVEWQDGIVNATRLAVGSNDVTAHTVAANIQNLGIIRVDLDHSIDLQNEAIDAMAQEAEAARALADQAARQRQSAINRAENLQRALERQAATPAPVENMESTVRQVQDDVYDAGL